MTIEIGGISGGIKPVTSMNSVLLTGDGPTASWPNTFGATLTADITSATLTEVLNISGSGYLTFSAVRRGAGSDATSHKIRIVIDGVEALNEVSGGILSSLSYATQLGTYFVNNKSGFEGVIIFNTSLVVEIAGDGTNPANYAYKRYLT